MVDYQYAYNSYLEYFDNCKGGTCSEVQYETNVYLCKLALSFV
jgi:hypothetical protein